MKRGSLIVLEGIDGGGKSTQLALLVDALRAEGRDVVRTREPTDGPIGRRIREMAASEERVAPEQELAWFMEDRAEHVAEVIEPALAAGRVVVSDRYYLSTVAYQGARGLDWEAILAESERRFPTPTLALVLEIDPAAGLARVERRADTAEPAFEEQGFLEHVASIFAAIDRPWIERIDARGDVESVAAALQGAVARRLGPR